MLIDWMHSLANHNSPRYGGIVVIIRGGKRCMSAKIDLIVDLPGFRQRRERLLSSHAGILVNADHLAALTGSYDIKLDVLGADAERLPLIFDIRSLGVSQLRKILSNHNVGTEDIGSHRFVRRSAARLIVVLGFRFGFDRFVEAIDR